MDSLIRALTGIVNSNAVSPDEPVRVRPETEEQVAAVLSLAAARRLAVLVQGAGTRAHLGNSVRADLVLETLGLDRVVEYNAADLTVTVQPGMRLQALQSTLAVGGQWLPIDPPRASACTVGGIVAAAASGPRRLLYGSARDLVLGMRIALTDGTVVHCGGRVVKNVAGYDMNKLFVGSMGTLGVITELTFKVRPRLAAARTLLLSFPNSHCPLAFARAVLHSELTPAAVEYLSPGVCAGLGVPGPHALAVALEEAPAAVAYQQERLEVLARPQGRTEVATLEGEAAMAFWQGLTDYADAAGLAAVVRLNLLMTQVDEAVEQIMNTGVGADMIARCGCGQVYAYLSGASTDAVVQSTNALLDYAAAAGGTAVVEHAVPPVRERVALWGRRRPEQFLMDGLKQRFDPQGVLNPGRLNMRGA